MKEDMGPFASMPQELVNALTRYGTPPIRQKITVEVVNVWHSSFRELPRTPSGFIDWINEQTSKAPEEFRDKLSFCLDYEEGYYDSGDYSTLKISYERMETDAEMIERVNKGIEYIRGKEEEERYTFMRLKKKYE